MNLKLDEVNMKTKKISRYIFVDRTTGEYTILNKNIYPENIKNDYELISQKPVPEVLDIPKNPESIKYRNTILASMLGQK